MDGVQRSGIAEGGIFYNVQPGTKINRITNADKHFIDAAKQVKPELMMIENER